jgi:hypothetical protein
MAASVTRYAMATLCRARHGLEDKLSAGDIAEFDALAPALSARDDLTVRTSRTVCLARKPDNRAGRKRPWTRSTGGQLRGVGSSEVGRVQALSNAR